jgi:beta-glucanase (GH16 family)
LWPVNDDPVFSEISSAAENLMGMFQRMSNALRLSASGKSSALEADDTRALGVTSLAVVSAAELADRSAGDAAALPPHDAAALQSADLTALRAATTGRPGAVSVSLLAAEDGAARPSSPSVASVSPRRLTPGAGSASASSASAIAPVDATVPTDCSSTHVGIGQPHETADPNTTQSAASVTAATKAVSLGGVLPPTAGISSADADAATPRSAEPAALSLAARTSLIAARNTVSTTESATATISTSAVAPSAAQGGPVSNGADATVFVAEPAVASAATTATVAPALATGETYAELTNSSNLTFDDEFNTFVSSPDGSAGWMTTYPWDGEDARTSPSNGEAEYYSDPSVGTNPFTDTKGILDITAKIATPGSNPYDLPYTSGIITSYKSLAQTYGYFEIRAELPAGQGLWPAFWLDPVALPTTSELDVFEVLGNAPTTLYSTVHTYPVGGVWSEDSQELTVANTSTGFNTYGVDWEPTTITFYMNGQVIATAPTPSTMNAPMYMLANLAVGGPASWPGAPSSNSEFPATYQIDYVRAYATPATIQVSGTQAILTSAVTGQLLLEGKGSAGATVDLKSAGGFVIKTTETSASGSFGFTGLSAGDYQVEFVPPTGQTLASGGPANTATGLTSTLTLADGQTLTLAAELLTPPPGASTPITMTPATEAVATTDAATTKPFSNVVITDANAGASESVTVTLTSAANGILTDPNAETDGSTVVNGVWNAAGSSTAVAAALDGLVFKPTAHQVAPGSDVTTTVTAAIEDTAGEKYVGTSKITATAAATAISITPKTEAVATTDAASTKPFAGVSIIDVNAGQTETASVTVSAPANGILSDPHATTDGSNVTNGILTVSGSASVVASAIDGLVFKPTENQVTAGAAVETAVTVAIRDAAGETASAKSTITATHVTTPPPVTDTIMLNTSEDYADGDAEFTVSVNGQQVAGDYEATALQSSGDAGVVSLTGDWGSGLNDVRVSFINHAYGRNLYVNSISENGVTYAGTSAAFPRDGSDTFSVGGTTPTETAPADSVTFHLSEDAYAGDALFALYIDGKVVTKPEAVTALHEANQTQGFTFTGNFGAGTHTIGIACVNNTYGKSPGEERNVYVDGITLNGSDVFSGAQQVTNTLASFVVTTAH